MDHEYNSQKAFTQRISSFLHKITAILKSLVIHGKAFDDLFSYYLDSTDRKAMPYNYLT